MIRRKVLFAEELLRDNRLTEAGLLLKGITVPGVSILGNEHYLQQASDYALKGNRKDALASIAEWWDS